MSALCSARGGGWTEHEATGLIAGVPVPDEAGKIDTLVLGCTHYPLLTEAIAGVLGERVTLIDSGEAASARSGHCSIPGFAEPERRPTEHTILRE